MRRRRPTVARARRALGRWVVGMVASSAAGSTVVVGMVPVLAEAVCGGCPGIFQLMIRARCLSTCYGGAGATELTSSEQKRVVRVVKNGGGRVGRRVGRGGAGAVVVVPPLAVSVSVFHQALCLHLNSKRIES